MVPTLFLVTLIVFLMVRFIPGSVVDLMVSQMAAESGLGAELTAEWVRSALGLDVPIHIQYVNWLGNALQGDLGQSLWTGRDILPDLIRRVPVSAELGFIGLVTAIVISLPIGTYSAIRQDTAGDYIGRTIAILCISVPSFWIATMVVVYPSIYLNWSPPVQYIPLIENPAGNIAQFLLPGVIQGMMIAGAIMRLQRTMMLEVLRQDYIRTAWSKGLNERVVVLRHALKNALIPVVTSIGMMIPMMVAGSVVLEQIFCLPGVGLLLIEALNKRDYPVISGINLMVASVILVINLVVDLTYGYLDPRISYR